MPNKVFSPEFEAYRKSKFEMPPGDCPWNPYGFKGDYTQPTISEMSAHMPILQYFASHCDVVCELGSRNANSTVAFLSGARQKVISYDIQPTGDTVKLLEMKAKGQLPCNWEFRQLNTIDPRNKVEEVDGLFVDSLHTFFQVQQELAIHASQVRKWIAFHDWFSQKMGSLDSPGSIGIGPAIEEFLENHPEYRKIYEVQWNHGLLIIEKD